MFLRVIRSIGQAAAPSKQLVASNLCRFRPAWGDARLVVLAGMLAPLSFKYLDG